MNKYVGGVVDYWVLEGKIVEIFYKGVVEEIVKDILGSLRLICIYVGVSCFKELIKWIIFIWV